MSVAVDMGIEQYATDCLGAAMLDAALTLEAVSEGVLTIGGYERDKLIGLTAFELIHPDDHQRAGEAMLELLRTQVPTVEGIYRMLMGDGTYCDWAVRAVTIPHRDGAKTVMKFSEVSPVLRAEEFARDAVDTLHMLGESNSLDECLERVHLLTERHLPGTRLAISTMRDGAIRTHTRRPDRSFRAEFSAGATPANVERALAYHLTGPWRAFNRMANFEPTANGSVVTSVLTDDANQLLGYVELSSDSHNEPDTREWMVHGLVRQVLTVLLRRVRLDEQLKQAAEHDPLTGLANRRRLFADMAASDDLTGTTLLLIDLDGFSWVNNNLGHHVGDQALVALGQRLRELCPPDATIARFGGDEFVVWSAQPIADLAGLGHALRSSKIMPAGAGDRRSSLRCSIGAIAIRAGESATAAIKRADEAMYTAKSNGGDNMHLG